MFKKIIFAFMLAISLNSWAQTPGVPGSSASSPVGSGSATHPPAPPCWPSPFGNGSVFKTNAANNGVWAWWYCSNKVKYTYSFVWISSDKWNAVNFYNGASSLMSIPKADQPSKLLSLWNENVTTDVSPEGLKFASWALLDIYSNWNVPLNGSLKTRPTYPILANGTVGTIPNGSSPVGSDCSCIAKRIEGRYTYCGVASTTGTIRSLPVPIENIDGTFLQVDDSSVSVGICEPKTK